MVELENVEAAEDIGELKALIEKHALYTDSPVAYRLLADWPKALAKFVKVMPSDYKRVLRERKEQTHHQAGSIGHSLNQDAAAAV
jgi:glutamate synthase domain-containing protein 3